MDFFDEAPRQLSRPPSGEPWGPPDKEFPNTVSTKTLLVARSDTVALARTDFSAFKTGFEFSVRALFRSGASPSLEAPADESIRIGLQFSDGRRGATFSRRPDPPDDVQPPEIVLRSLVFGGGIGYQYWRYWVWPLPPKGSLDFICEWPALGVPISYAHTTAQPILDAASQSIMAWSPDS